MKVAVVGMRPLKEANVDPIELAYCLAPVISYLLDDEFEKGIFDDQSIDVLEPLIWDLNPEVLVLLINPKALNPKSAEQMMERRYHYRELWANPTGPLPPTIILKKRRGARDWNPGGGEGLYSICFGDDQVYTAIEMGIEEVFAIDVTSIDYYEIIDILRQRWRKQFPELEWGDK